MSYYRGDLTPELAALQAAGIDVVVTELDPLRDSNAAVQRRVAPAGFKWWLKSEARLAAAEPARWPDGRVSLGALLRLLNFKANHRKVALTRDAAGRCAASSHPPIRMTPAARIRNVALAAAGAKRCDRCWRASLRIARLSGWQGALPHRRSPPARHTALPEAERSRVARAATEGAIRDALLERIGAAGRGSCIDIAMFYLTQRDVIEALIAAARRGAAVRVLLDPNKDAFGFEKSGLPNRQVASELLRASDGAVRVRWFRTHGEQFHAKLVTVRDERHTWLTLGSANLTRRNLGDYNLEANVVVETPTGGRLATGVLQWFEMLWSNRAGAGVEYSADAETYADPSQGRYWLYRLMEASGLSTF